MLAAWYKRKKVAVTAGTLSTCSPLFVFLLVFVVLLVGALSFFPALALGPIAEFFGNVFNRGDKYMKTETKKCFNG